MKEIALALGGGGAKGHAHVGVIRVLEREGFIIKAISGTSAGGLWGAFYAAGYSPQEIEKRMQQVSSDDLYTRRSSDGPAMLGLAGLEDLLIETLGDRNFEDLRIPFAVTAVDIDTAEAIILRRGRVREALLATIAVPGVFPPRPFNGRILIDGGILDPVPVNLARTLAPGLPVVAVVLSPRIDEWVKPSPPRLLDSLPFLSSYISRLRIARAFNIFLRSIDIGGAMLTELRLEIDRPEVIIRPAVPHIGLLDDVDSKDVVELGALAAELALPDLRRVVGWRSRISRRMYPRRFREWDMTASANDFRLAKDV
jgi:NTE family protein